MFFYIFETRGVMFTKCIYAKSYKAGLYIKVMWKEEELSNLRKEVIILI